ncbi:uncharacterized protein LOC106070422 isoform X1 [Biomphalaria glabrata]|uniref:Uncharacterized protein LOC106070422 isoform X1 n=1 Tax=Biomphalaria glabrata TaxID=6526 RepID=A0A9W2YN09_BIOGL|nr:uncharacterized protein LOC106070422 isoform X1 [Biomphalaria glabrata]XP_055864079.1 uncharacterized protein LOC106070422 isoform X1 [Biomphalaria glabrata]XP_055864080.1 uncharacterized protein LOC106070422 isoform X1 [Biomphalaria glabrata]XP_055864081.1 uncharacterized protein LOC106070422 isoform X1 [Biomphalaria glabrata]XP_055864082.1 uncharacterized protein LOC106070422 isoform X1 [Biomphalaria glabrata]XP_055864083.1 uncharacterized protein LOC106070422 isoform X1 [Biomphalaria gla
MNRLLVSVGLMLILFQSLAECSLSKNVTLKEGQTFTLECSIGNRSDWWITYNGTRVQVSACIAHISTCIYQIISDNDNYRASYYKPKGYVSDSNTTSTTSFFQVLHVQRGLTKIECSNDFSSVSWDVTVVDLFQPQRINLLVNSVKDYVKVRSGTDVILKCWAERDVDSPLFIYKDNPKNVLKKADLYVREVEHVLTIDVNLSVNVTIGCRSGEDEATATVAVIACHADNIRFTANSRSDVVDVNPDSLVQFTCTADAVCAKELTLVRGTDFQVLSQARLPQVINKAMTNFECGHSFYVGCHAGDVGSQKNILVRAAPCVTLTVNGETSDVVSTCDSTTVTVSCQYEGQSKSTLSLLWRSSNDEMIVLTGTLDNKLTYTLPQEFTARRYSLFTNWIECSLRGAVDVTTKVRLVIEDCYEPTTKAQPFVKKEGIVVGVSVGGSSFLFVMVVILTLYCTRAHRLARREASGRRHSSLRSQPHISLTLDTVQASDPPEYTEVFSGRDFSTAPPPPDYYSLPPSYDNVAHFYKHNGVCVIEYISDQSLDQSTDQSIDQLHQTTNQTIDQNTNQPLEQSTYQSIYQSSHHSADQSTDQTSNQSTDQTSNQSTDQASNQPTYQSIHPSAE